MPRIGIIMYVNAFIYYFIVFAVPLYFVEPCGEGLNMMSHYIYAGYSIIAAIFELITVFKIQREIRNPDILKFNIWHFIELLMGQVARFDTYLDVCFACMIYSCEQWFLFWPISVFIFLFIIYPTTMLFKLMRVRRDLNHTLPVLERNSQLCFIRENMLLATVLDSFCIENYTSICNKPIVFGKTQAAWTFIMQDFPQFTIHILFMLFVHDGVPHADFTVKLSLMVSTIAVCISGFNFIMCGPNDFDPILLQIELKQRKETKAIAKVEEKKHL
jgi:hypothetical protein